MSYVILDLETTTRTEFKRKATPFNNRNRIVAIGYKKKGETRNTGKYFATGKSEAGEYVGGAPDGWLVPLLEGTSVLAGFNIKFDVLHAICQGPSNRQAWIEYIDRGGKVWDGQLAEYLLNGMSHEYQMASLDEVAPRYGGNLKNDAVKALWAAGVETYDIDQDMLMEYLVGYESWHNEPHPAGLEDYGDIGNTEKVFLGQVEALRARKGLKSALLNMGALVFTIEAEYNGMFVDLPWALSHAGVLKQQLAEATAELDTFIPKDLPFEFKWTSRFHKSALIFGGDVKYEARCPILDSSGQQVYAQMDQERVLLEGYDPKGSAEQQALHITAAELLRWQTEDPDTAPKAATYAGGKNKGEVKAKKFKVPDPSKPKSRMETFTYRFTGYTQPEKKWEGADAGVYSTAADVIEELAGRNIPFLRALARRADIHKALSTYFIVTDEDTGESKGMLTLVGPDGIVHHQVHMVRTVTGRLSSSDPNLTNVAKGSHNEETGEMTGNQIKRAFTSRFAGGKIVQSDFTSLEIYVQAALTQCTQLIEDLRLGLDMHSLRAEQAWGKPEGKDYAYIVAAAKDDKHPEHAKWKKLRGAAKGMSFARAYGAGVAKIVASTGMSVEDVEALIAAEAIRYPEIDAYVARMTDHIKANRVPTSRFCQHPDVPGLQCQLGRSHYTTPDGKLYSFSESPSPKFLAERPASRGGCAQSFSPTEIKNYTVQGTGGEFAKAAMYLAARAFYRLGNFGDRALLVNMCHDAIYVDAKEDIHLDAAALLEAAMLEATPYMEYHFGWKQPLQIPCETKIGNTMMEEHNPGAGFDELVAQYRKQIRADFIGNHKPSFEQEIAQ